MKPLNWFIIGAGAMAVATRIVAGHDHPFAGWRSIIGCLILAIVGLLAYCDDAAPGDRNKEDAATPRDCGLEPTRTSATSAGDIDEIQQARCDRHELAAIGRTDWTRVPVEIRRQIAALLRIVTP